jgi:hypothetical protein
MMELDFLEIQRLAVKESNGPHLSVDIAAHLAALDRRMDALEVQLRARAKAIGESAELSLSQLHSKLAEIGRRDPAYVGPERRRPASG